MKVSVIRDVDNVSQSFFCALTLVVSWTDPDYAPAEQSRSQGNSRSSRNINSSSEWVPTVSFTNAVSLQV